MTARPIPDRDVAGLLAAVALPRPAVRGGDGVKPMHLGHEAPNGTNPHQVRLGRSLTGYDGPLGDPVTTRQYTFDAPGTPTGDGSAVGSPCRMPCR
nr:hypothetical protein OG999_02470 [Streptomyces sp. NBC_00886]